MSCNTHVSVMIALNGRIERPVNFEIFYSVRIKLTNSFIENHQKHVAFS